MTRKDYILIATALASVRESYAPNWDANLFRACDDHAAELANALAETSSSFDRERFYKACGFGERG
jgi:hypothetical protein